MGVGLRVEGLGFRVRVSTVMGLSGFVPLGFFKMESKPLQKLGR